jgi:hypothetical protein
MIVVLLLMIVVLWELTSLFCCASVRGGTGARPEWRARQMSTWTRSQCGSWRRS